MNQHEAMFDEESLPNKLIQPTRNTRGANGIIRGRSADHDRYTSKKGTQ